MKKILIFVVAVLFTLTINANPDTSNEFTGSLTILTQYMDGYHNVQLKWEDNSVSNDYYAYIITEGNSDNEENHVVKGYTRSNSFAIFNVPNLANISPQYNVYKMNFNQEVQLENFFSTGNGDDFRGSLTWAQIKELLKKKSNNIWKIRRNNIPTSDK